MPDQSSDLTEKLKALGNKSATSFTPEIKPDPPIIHTEPLKTPPVSGKATTITQPTGMPKDDVSPHMTNLINESKKRNEALANEFTKPGKTEVMFKEGETEKFGLDFRSRSEQVLTILKNHGMDTQQAEKAHKLIMEL